MASLVEVAWHVPSCSTLTGQIFRMTAYITFILLFLHCFEAINAQWYRKNFTEVNMKDCTLTVIHVSASLIIIL